MARSLARSIKTKRDYHGATALAQTLREQGESAEERRLQALLREIEKFDTEDEEDEALDMTEALDDIPRRRWSDD